MASTTRKNMTRKQLVFNHRGDKLNGQTSLVYFVAGAGPRIGQHIVYLNDFEGPELKRGFARIEDARAYWKQLRTRIESQGYVAAELITA